MVSTRSVELPARDSFQSEVAGANVALVPAGSCAIPATVHADRYLTPDDPATMGTRVTERIRPAKAICASRRRTLKSLTAAFMIRQMTDWPLTFLTTRREVSLFQKSQTHGSSSEIRIQFFGSSTNENGADQSQPRWGGFPACLWSLDNCDLCRRAKPRCDPWFDREDAAAPEGGIPAYG